MRVRLVAVVVSSSGSLSACCSYFGSTPFFAFCSQQPRAVLLCHARQTLPQRVDCATEVLCSAFGCASLRANERGKENRAL